MAHGRRLVIEQTRALERLAGEPGLLEALQANIEAPRGFGDYVDELERYYGGERPSRVAAEPPTAVAWAGEHDAPTSLARINRRVVAELAQRDDLVVRAAATDRLAPAAPLPHTADVEVRHQWPPDLRPPASGHLALIQPWEFGAVPSAWVEPLNTVADELWVPSEHVREMYVGSGVAADRVHVVPNGVDLEAYAPEGPALDLGPRAGVRFLFVGGAIGRKGIDVLLAAWREAFPGREHNDLLLWIESQRLVIAGDTLPDFGEITSGTDARRATQPGYTFGSIHRPCECSTSAPSDALLSAA